MLHQFLSANRANLIAQCNARVAERGIAEPSSANVVYGIPLFIDQLIKVLELQHTDGVVPGQSPSAAHQDVQAGSEMRVSATQHGRELMQRGFTVEQVIRDYGDLCQAITGLAFERGVSIEVSEFRTLNRCLDDGIALAVTEYAYQRDFLLAENAAAALSERLGFLAHELRNFLNTTTLTIAVIKSGSAGFAGATGAVLDRSLVGMRTLIDRSLADVRLMAGMPARYQFFSVADFISDIQISASLEAAVHECKLIVSAVDPTLAVDADRDMLFSAVGNLLQNAFKFTEHRSEVILNARAQGDRVLISVEDHCGGLPPGDAEKMFQPFTQNGANKSGLGLGLAISRRSTEANNGVISVRDIAGKGCVFTIDLPRYATPDTQAPE